MKYTTTTKPQTVPHVKSTVVCALCALLLHKYDKRGDNDNSHFTLTQISFLSSTHFLFKAYFHSVKQ